MLLGLIRTPLPLAGGGCLRPAAGPELELDAEELPDVVDSASTLLAEAAAAVATAVPIASSWDERKPSLNDVQKWSVAKAI